MIDAKDKYGPITLGLFSIVMTGVWAYASGTLAIGLFSGGLPVLIYSSLAVGAGLSVMCVCLAQFGSAHPHEAGCTLIATKIGGPQWGRAAGFFTGGFHTLAVICTPAANITLCCQLVATLGTILRPEWIPKHWQIFLIFQAMNVSFVAGIRVGFKYINWFTNIAVVFLIVTFFAVIGVLGKNSTGSSSNEFVWNTIVNNTGWSTPVCVFIGMSNVLYIYGPPHWLLNMAEDVENPRRSLPIAIGVQQLGNISTLFGFLVAAAYAITDWDSLLETTYPAPAGALFQQAVKSKGGAFALMLCITIPTLVGNMSYMGANLRLVHGFAATGALPYRSWLLQMSSDGEVAVNLLYTLGVVNTLLSCIYVGSPVGFTIILSAANLLYTLGFLPIFICYIATNGRYLGKGGWFKPPHAVSMACAIFTFFYLTVVIMIYCLPPVYPVTAQNMNWSCIFGLFGVAFLLLVWNFYAKRRYIGYPEILEEEDATEKVTETHVPVQAKGTGATEKAPMELLAESTVRNSH